MGGWVRSGTGNVKAEQSTLPCPGLTREHILCAPVHSFPIPYPVQAVQALPLVACRRKHSTYRSGIRPVASLCSPFFESRWWRAVSPRAVHRAYRLQQLSGAERHPIGRLALPALKPSLDLSGPRSAAARCLAKRPSRERDVSTHEDAGAMLNEATCLRACLEPASCLSLNSFIQFIP